MKRGKNLKRRRRRRKKVEKCRVFVTIRENWLYGVGIISFTEVLFDPNVEVICDRLKNSQTKRVVQ